jgi:hypothetical protein
VYKGKENSGCSFRLLEGASQLIDAVGIEADENKKQDGETEQRGAPVTEKRQRDPDHRQQAQRHSDIDGEVKEQDRCHTVAIDSVELVPLAFGKEQYAP